MNSPVTPVIYEKTGAIARIRFNRPDVLNAIDLDMARAFADVMCQVAADPEIRAVVLSGEGKAFIAGGDLKQLRQGAAGELITPMHEAIQRLTALPVPVLVAVHGAVSGAGLSLAMACDLVLAAEGTRFNLAYVNVGASCDVGASWHLPRLVGLHKAMEIALLGETFDAAEACRLGIVNRVVPAAELADATEKMVQRLANGPTVALGHLKQLLRASLNTRFADQLDAEEAGFKACAQTQDFAESIDAFFAKRPPQLNGR